MQQESSRRTSSAAGHNFTEGYVSQVEQEIKRVLQLAYDEGVKYLLDRFLGVQTEISFEDTILKMLQLHSQADLLDDVLGVFSDPDSKEEILTSVYKLWSRGNQAKVFAIQNALIGVLNDRTRIEDFASSLIQIDPPELRALVAAKILMEVDEDRVLGEVDISATGARLLENLRQVYLSITYDHTQAIIIIGLPDKGGEGVGKSDSDFDNDTEAEPILEDETTEERRDISEEYKNPDLERYDKKWIMNWFLFREFDIVGLKGTFPDGEDLSEADFDIFPTKKVGLPSREVLDLFSLNSEKRKLTFDKLEILFRRVLEQNKHLTFYLSQNRDFSTKNVAGVTPIARIAATKLLLRTAEQVILGDKDLLISPDPELVTFLKNEKLGPKEKFRALFTYLVRKLLNNNSEYLRRNKELKEVESVQGLKWLFQTLHRKDIRRWAARTMHLKANLHPEFEKANSHYIDTINILDHGVKDSDLAGLDSKDVVVRRKTVFFILGKYFGLKESDNWDKLDIEALPILFNISLDENIDVVFEALSLESLARNREARSYLIKSFLGQSFNRLSGTVVDRANVILREFVRKNIIYAP